MGNNIFVIFGIFVRRLSSGRLLPGDRLPGKKPCVGVWNQPDEVVGPLNLLKEQGILVSRKRAGTRWRRINSPGVLARLLNQSSRIVYVLCSSVPIYNHWNRTTFGAWRRCGRVAIISFR